MSIHAFGGPGDKKTFLFNRAPTYKKCTLLELFFQVMGRFKTCHFIALFLGCQVQNIIICSLRSYYHLSLTVNLDFVQGLFLMPKTEASNAGVSSQFEG